MRFYFLAIMTGLILAGLSMGDSMPLLNPYELLRHSGLAFLPESGTRFIADQAKLGKGALPAAWAAYLAVSFVGSIIIDRIWRALS